MASDTSRLIDHVRGVRYGEVIAAFDRDGRFEAEVFGTQFLNDCPQDLWDGLDANALAEELGAVMVKLNGPRHWVLDGHGRQGQRAWNRYYASSTASLCAGWRSSTSATTRSPPRTQKSRSTAVRSSSSTPAKPVYELVDPDGLAYVMQALCVGVDPAMAEAEPARDWEVDWTCPRAGPTGPACSTHELDRGYHGHSRHRPPGRVRELLHAAGRDAVARATVPSGACPSASRRGDRRQVDVADVGVLG